MIKLNQCLKSLPGMSAKDFRTHWDVYQERLIVLAEKMCARRLVVSTTLNVEANLQLMIMRGSGVPFDGVVEMWFDRGAGLEEMLDEPEVQGAMESLQDAQDAFVDFARSSFFFSTEKALVDG